MSKELDPNKCQEEVSGAGSWGAFHTHQCRNPVKVQREGKNYCTIHDPERIKAKNEANQKKWEKQLAESEKKWAYEKEMRENYPKLKSQNAKLREALKRAAGFIKGLTGEIPDVIKQALSETKEV